MPLIVEAPTLDLTDLGPKSGLDGLNVSLPVVTVERLTAAVLLAAAGGNPVFMDLDLTLERLVVDFRFFCNSLLVVDTSFLSAAALSTFCILSVANAKSFTLGIFWTVFATLLCVGLAV